jgi:flagellar hook-length control protein FliK
MDFAITLPPELASAIDPLGRGQPGLARPPAGESGAGPPLGSFDLVLQLLGSGTLPGGELLPEGGNDLPPATELAPGDEETGTAFEPALPLAVALALPVAPSAPELAEPGTVVAAPRPAPAPTPTPAFAAAEDAALPQPTVPQTTTKSDLPIVAEASANAAPADGLPVETLATTDAAEPPASHETVMQTLRARSGAEAQAALRPDSVAPTREPHYFDTRSRPRHNVPVGNVLEPLAADAPSEVPARAETNATTVDALRARAPSNEVTRLAMIGRPDAASPIPTSGDAAPTAGVSPAPHAPLAPSSSTATSAQNPTATPSSLHQTQQPIDTRAERWHDALASRIQWIVDHDVGEARIKLNPPELGALDVRVAVLDDKTFVQMTTHAAATRDELVQSLPRLRELLVAGGLDLGGATVSGGRDDRPGQHTAHAPLDRALRFTAAEPSAVAERAVGRLSGVGRIDTFA